MRLALVVAILSSLVAVAPARAAGGGSAVAGRLVLRQEGKVVALREVRRRTGKKLGLQLRNGSAVIEVRVDDDGWFVAPAAPGRWRFEYLAVGDGAEFFSPAREIEVQVGQVSCVGQFELTMADVEAELGANSGSTLEVRDSCGSLAPRLRELGGGPVAATPVRSVDPASPRRDAIEILSGLRGEYAWHGVGGSTDQGSSFRGNFVLGLRGPLDTSRNFLLTVGAGTISRQASGLASATSTTFALGGGLAPFSALELLAGADYVQSRSGYAGGPGVFASARFGVYAFGLGLRARSGGGGRDVALTVDLSPLYLVGSLL
jgi:hypothetical protein